MCLAMPVLVLELTSGDQATVDLDGVKREISLALVDDVQPGDYVILHAGFALQKLDREEADRTLALFADLARAEAA
jgi:hydrogenase expression/formation protein HypC